MKIIRLLFVITALLFTAKINAQTCTASFDYTVNPNGSYTFFNTSVASNPTLSLVYQWDLGNGATFTTTSLSQTVSTTYTINTNYNVFMEMTDPSPSTCFSSTTQTISYATPGCPLSASATAVAVGTNAASFTSASTGTNSGTTYSWDFGDGTTGSGVNPTHIYAGNGGFGYTLTASNNATCSAIFNYYLPFTICNYTPSISYTVGAAGVVTFTENQTFYGYQLWTGDYWNVIGTNPTHIYYNGTYTPTLLVINSVGCNHPTYSISCAPITITNNVCDANAAFTYTTGSGGSVQFSKTAPSSNTNIAYLWHFGDNTFSTLVNPTHTYASAGNYTVTLRSYDITYSLTSGLYDTNYVTGPCRTFSRTNLNVTGIPCITNSSFSISPSGIPQDYNLTPAYPFNYSAVTWYWGDGDSSNTLYAYHTYTAPGNYNICLTVTTTCGGTSSTCVNQYLSKRITGDMISVGVVFQQMTDGIEENTMEGGQLQVFPNPSDDGIINIQLSEEIDLEKITVYDLLGKEVYRGDPPQNKTFFKVDLSGLNNGIYFLRLKASENSLRSKFLISR